MKITAEILYYLFLGRRPDHTFFCQTGTPGLPLEYIAQYHPGKTIRENTIYLLAAADLEVWSSELTEEPVSCLVWGMGERPAHDIQTILSSRPQDNILAIPGGEPSSLLEELSNFWHFLTRWESRLVEPILRQDSGTESLSLGEELFPYGYALIDLDMYVLYATSTFWESTDPSADFSSASERLSEDAVRNLMIHREFHEAARETNAFYYYDDHVDLTALCRNIFLDNHYCARIVMYLFPGESQVSSGLNELFEVFSDHIQNMFRFGSLRLRRNPRDPLHLLCQAMLDTGRTDENTLRSVLPSFSWQLNDTYIVLNIQFFSESGWNTQWETTLPFLCGELERRWPDSCAIPDASDIRWVINLSRASITEDLRLFRQEIAYFLRDNLCRAGVSPRFSDFRQLSYALKAADDALRIGRSRQPHFWYYVFDDYRLTYMMETVQQDLPVSMLCHPAIHQLLAYDREHGTDMALTLKAYLTHGLNMTAAADAIYIHRTTFCRRMDRIREITGLNLEEPGTILELLISYQLFH